MFVTNVPKDVGSLNVNQFGFEETYNGVPSHLKSCLDGDWRTKDYFHQLDSCVEVAIQRQKEQVSIQISKIDARIMWVVIGRQQLEARLEPASAHDFGTILIPLMKSFMRTRLEELSEKDATKKSDAVWETFLAELALDSKKGNGARFDVSKHVNERTRKRARRTGKTRFQRFEPLRGTVFSSKRGFNAMFGTWNPLGKTPRKIFFLHQMIDPCASFFVHFHFP